MNHYFLIIDFSLNCTGFQEEYNNLMKQRNEVKLSGLNPTVICDTNTKSNSTDLCFSDNLLSSNLIVLNLNDKVEIVESNDSISSSINIDDRKLNILYYRLHRNIDILSWLMGTFIEGKESHLPSWKNVIYYTQDSTNKYIVKLSHII